jgi:outer membrane protein
MRGRCAALFAVAAALWSIAESTAARADSTAPSLRPAVFDWTITVGAEGRVEPLFQGSDREALRPYPIFAVRRFGTAEPFRGPRDGIGVGLVDGSNFALGPVGQIVRPRNESMDGALQGLGNVPWAFELGMFGEYWSTPWLRTRAEVRQGFNGHHGVVSDIMMDAVVPVGPQWTLSGGPRVTLASMPAVDPYFSVNAAQSAASGLPVFDARGGIRSVGAGTQARFLWNSRWATHAFVEYERLAGDIASSPVVTQRGSANQLTIGFGATHFIDVKRPW